MTAEKNTRILKWMKKPLPLMVISFLVMTLAVFIVPRWVAIIQGFDHEVTWVAQCHYECFDLKRANETMKQFGLDKSMPAYTRENCPSYCDLTLANSGKEIQQLVEITLPSSGKLSLGSYVQGTPVKELVATTRERPEVSPERGELPGTYRIVNMPPNILVEMVVTTRGLHDARELAELGIGIHAEGIVINRDPQGSVLVRMLYAMATAFKL